MPGVSNIPLERVREVVRGRVLLPQDPAFDEARRPWNLAIEQAPLAVVEAADADDVAALVRFAADHGVAIATQPSGHGATGRVGGAILLRTADLDAIDIDPVAQTARVGAGVRFGVLQEAAAAHALTALPGSSPVVSVAGAALGGGLSWFGRAYGWIADSILGADVVLADGTMRHVDESEPDLLWALRGGGGEIAIVTALEVRLRPAPLMFGGRMLWPAVHARAAAEAFRTITQSAPDALTVWFSQLHYPGGEPLIAIDATFLGPERDARAAMSPVDAIPLPLVDTRAAMSVATVGEITAEPTTPSPGISRGELLTHLDDAALDAFLRVPIAPLMTVQLRHLGGALARPSDSPHGALTEPFALFMLGLPFSPEGAEAIRGAQANLVASLPTSGRTPISFLSSSGSLSSALPEESVRRLRAVKDAYDPARIIRGNFALSE
ncbi:FAD-linked oxidase [Microbacterium testaceum]|uniref:FAD-binding oxidoreductase n=1 Tax=Microbacterium testaceum TaxID=2033 RepID=UPI000734620C|nr:FAD-binding oxidoreductase [Microbacterium testaceum]KTS90798.1 FAD-linked oxidase [Microbacterium testaceum]